MRSALDVRSRVWFRIHDSGTFHRAASSAESINSKPLQSLRDINWTSDVAVLMFSAAYGCMAVRPTAIRLRPGLRRLAPCSAAGSCRCDQRLTNFVVMFHAARISASICSGPANTVRG